MKNILNLIQDRHHTCPWWLCFTFDNPVRALFQNPVKMLSPYISEGDHVLDLGPGMGFCSFPMVDMVGEKGLVYAADIQKEMLEAIDEKAEKRKIRNIRTFLIEEKGLDIDETFSFILLFWMFHEVQDQTALLEELKAKLKDSGSILLVEPIVHVSRKAFDSEVELAEKSGFSVECFPKIAISNAAVLRKG